MLSSRELSEILTVRQFLQLCETVDMMYGKKASAGTITYSLGQDGNAGTQVVEYLQRNVKFDVVEANCYGPANKEVVIEVDAPNIGKVRNTIFWCNIVELPKDERVRTALVSIALEKSKRKS